MRATAHRSLSGFTLIEVMAVVFLTALVLGVALDYYYDLSNASQRAMDRTGEVRRATAILDRVAKDLQGASLMTKPAEADRLSHPWIFLGENHGFASEGSDRIKFFTRSYQPKRQSKGRHESDRAVVTYSIDEDEDGNLLLRRGVSTRFPDRLDRDFPHPDETQLLTDELESISLTFLDEAGVWQPVWDSSQLVQADQLPVAVMIELVLAESVSLTDERDDLEAGEFADEEGVTFSRKVVIPVRPIDLAMLYERGRSGPGGDGNGQATDDEIEAAKESMKNCASGRTVRQCFNIEAAQAAVDAGGAQAMQQYLDNPAMADSCADSAIELMPPAFIRPECL